jgi:hypothetical protein
VKQGFIHVGGFKTIGKEFAPAFDCVQPLGRKLLSMLFLLTQDRELDVGTPAGANSLHEPILKAFESAVAGLETDA